MLRYICLIVFFSLTAAAVQASGWVVERLSNQVHYSTDGATWHVMRPGMEVPNDSWVATGPRARALFARGAERIILRADTVAAVQTWNADGVQTLITQNSGGILLSLITRGQPHTTVQTPHLAAVVKGTVFEVTVGSNESLVRVDRGRVSIRDRRDRRSVDVTIGQEAVVDGSTRGVRMRAASGSSLRAGNRLSLDPVPQASSRGAPSVGDVTGGSTSTGTSQTQATSNSTSNRTPATGNNGNGSGNNGSGNNGNGSGTNGNGSGNNGNGSGNNGNGSGNNGNGSGTNGNGSGNNGNGDGSNGNNGNGNNGNGNNGQRDK